MTRTSNARSAAEWRSADEVWLDHSALAETDREWLLPIRRLTLWSVKVAPILLPSLPRLEWLDIRGGTGSDLAHVADCTHLRYLAVNQVRGMTDLSAVRQLDRLELLSLYGLPRVTAIPPLNGLYQLRRVEVGSMKNLTGLTGLLEAPVLEELLLDRAVGLSPDDSARISHHPTIRKFDWFAEDVPDRVWMPFVESVGLPQARSMSATDWFAARPGPADGV